MVCRTICSKPSSFSAISFKWGMKVEQAVFPTSKRSSSSVSSTDVIVWGLIVTVTKIFSNWHACACPVRSQPYLPLQAVKPVHGGPQPTGVYSPQQVMDLEHPMKPGPLCAPSGCHSQKIPFPNSPTCSEDVNLLVELNFLCSIAGPTARQLGKREESKWPRPHQFVCVQVTTTWEMQLCVQPMVSGFAIVL